MALNKFINPSIQNQSEINLQENLLIEMIQARGMDVLYLPKVHLTSDDILNEIVHSYHSRGMMIEMYLESYENYSDNALEFSKFGMGSISNEVVLIVSSRRFEECVSEYALEYTHKPNSGDLLYFPDIQEFFKIKKSNTDNRFIAKDRWVLTCTKYDENNNVSIDMTDHTDLTGGVFDPNYELGNDEYIPINDEMDALIKEFEGTIDRCEEITDDMREMKPKDIDVLLAKNNDADTKERKIKKSSEKLDAVSDNESFNAGIDDILS